MYTFKMIGTVLIYHSKGLLPWLIRKFTKSHWNHAGIIGKKTEYGYIVYEAQKDGLIKSEYTFEYLNRRLVDKTIVIKTPKVKIHNVEESCEKYLGTPYGVTTLLQIAWSLITKKTINKSDGLKRLICSEFVARVLYDISDKKINFEKEYKKHYDFITPSDLFNSNQLK